jgi:hypothetical protein
LLRGGCWSSGGSLGVRDFSATDRASIRNLGHAQYTLFFSGSERHHLWGVVEVALTDGGSTMLTLSDPVLFRKFLPLGFLGFF